MARPWVVWKRVQVHVAGDAAGAADAGDDGDLVQVELGLDQRAREAVDRGADAAARAPDVRHAVHAQERLDRIDGIAVYRARLRSSRGLHDGFQNHFGLVNAAAGVRHADRPCALPPAQRSTSRTIWPRFSSGTTKALTLRGQFADRAAPGTARR